MGEREDTEGWVNRTIVTVFVGEREDTKWWVSRTMTVFVGEG